MSSIKILVVDDEKDLLQLLINRLNRKGYEARGVTSAEAAIPLLKENVFDVAIYDIRMEKMDGLELLKETKLIQPETEVIMLTGHGTIDTAIEAMKLGAFDYLTKPYHLKELEVAITKAAENKDLKEKNEGMKQLIRTKEQGFEIIGKSPALEAVLTITKQVADSDIPILIEGESGTGKELFAKALHYWSCRAKEPFVAINSGALPEQLLESELFGHAKGAFTGAQQDKKGLVEAADGGTLFLDEIGEMPLAIQVKLLRFLESGEFRRVGDVRLRNVKTRVVAATNRNMELEVAEGRFREDLYYRLNVIKLTVPSLRERKTDISLLVEFYLMKKMVHGKKNLTEEALLALQQYDYPGNVRELFHIIERGILLSKGSFIEAKDLFLPRQLPQELPEQESCSLEELERRHIKKVLEETDWNKKKTAEILGISVRNLYRKIEQYQLEQ